jgi:predicted CXXCH cytochrome family protein
MMLLRLVHLAPRSSTTAAAAPLLAAALLLSIVGCEDHSDSNATKTSAKASADSLLHYEPPKAISAAVKSAAADLALPPAPRPTQPLAPDASCITAQCHATFASADHVHAPVGAESCHSCHQPDAGNHVYPLTRTGNETCTFCHTVTGTRAHEHQAVENPGCVACHDPHISTTKYLLKTDSVEQLCADCHQLPINRYTHGPVAVGQCTLCHQPHQSDSPRLLRKGEGAEHCFSCHTELRLSIANAAFVHQPAAESCDGCHDPHSSANPHQLHQPLQQTCFSCHQDMANYVQQAGVSHDALFTDDSCANCHDPHAASRPHMLSDRVDRLCLKCHDKPLTATSGRVIANMQQTLQREYLHGPIRSGDCTACHNAHGASNTRLLREKFPETFYAAFDLGNYALCFQCHDQQLVLKENTGQLTRFRNGETNLHFLHVNRDEKGRTCKTCHDMHGSDLPNHLASDVPFEGSQWSMPIAFEKTDDGGSCAPGCHEPRSYHRTPFNTQTALPRMPQQPPQPATDAQ